MRTKILEALRRIEEKKGVRVIYACESGSRAWGFASTNSDYDVRFIYVHPMDWYLSVDDRQGVIEMPIDENLDINGLDLRKSLSLLRKSNSVILERKVTRGFVLKGLRRSRITWAFNWRNWKRSYRRIHLNFPSKHLTMCSGRFLDEESPNETRPATDTDHNYYRRQGKQPLPNSQVDLLA